MSSKKVYQPIIYKYLKKFQEDPSSRVFAPLAEAYRKAGLVDEAISIAKEGLHFHPQFVGGKVALARAYFDKKQYEDVVNELSGIIQDIPDNIAAQRLIAESCLVLGRVAEALSSYKMILFFAPQDPEAARIVHELEVQSYEKGALILQKDLGQKDLGQKAQGAMDLGNVVSGRGESGSTMLPSFSIQSVSGAIDKDPQRVAEKRINQIERLQTALQQVARYRAFRDLKAPS